MSSRKKIGWTLAAIAFVLLAVIAGSSFYLVSYSLTPLHRSDSEQLDRLAENCPAALPQLDSLRAAGVVSDTTVTFDGRANHALMLRAPRDTAAVALLIHGYNDCALDMMHLACMYQIRLGMNVLVPDLPDHGHTPGPGHIDMGCGADLSAAKQWIEVARQMGGDSARVVMHGVSMGAATVMNASGERLPACVRCFVEDCGYTSVWDEFAYQMDEQFGLPPFPLLYTSSALCKALNGWSFGQVESIRRVAQCRLPMLLIHGGADDYVPTEMAYRLFAAKPEPKQLWIAPGSGHARSYSDHPDEYTARVREFLNKYMY